MCVRCDWGARGGKGTVPEGGHSMKHIRIASFALALLLLAALLPFGVFSAKAEGDEPAGDAPVIEKPVYVTVTDETGTPKAGATVQVLDSDGNVVETVENAEETFTVFLTEGTYTLKITKAPEGFLPPKEDAVITVEVTEAEEKDDIPANTVHDHDHTDYCAHPVNTANLTEDKGLPLFFVYDEGKEIPAYCFNQNYDFPYNFSFEYTDEGVKYTYNPEDHLYKRLVGTPELLYELAQCKWTGPNDEGFTPQEMYDHVVSMIYHRDDIKEKYGFDEVVTHYLVSMTIKQFTDGNMTTFKSTDEDGNNLCIRKYYPNGPAILDENGYYQFKPGGNVLGSIVGHGNGDNLTSNPDYVFPQAFKDAWHELIEMTDHPDDYYLYIYYPHNFMTKEQARNDPDSEWNFPAHYDPEWMYYANGTDQCLLSTFTVPPIRTTLKLRTLTEIEITKTWADEDDHDGFRPTAKAYTKMVHLLANGTDVTETYKDTRTVTDNGDGTYTVKFTDLPKYDDSEAEITYKIKEDAVKRYTADKTEVGNGGSITNTHVPETVDIPVEKIWKDGGNADGVRPEKITVHLFADGEEIDAVDITPDEDGSWKHTFRDLPKYRDGKEIEYSIAEDEVPEYTTEIEEGTYRITNTHGYETTEKTVTKEWVDGENADGVRPESITVHLSADGKEVASATITPDENGKWEYTFTDLPKSRDGVEIEYTVTEDPVPAYEAEYDALHITNKHVPETITIEGKKTWIEANTDPADVRPVKITIRLLADGEPVDSKTVTEKDGWKWTFENLPKYKDGKEIKYTIKEDRVKGYVPKVDGYDVTNTYTPPTGDTMHPWLWIGLLGAALLLCGGLLALEWISRRTE